MKHILAYLFAISFFTVALGVAGCGRVENAAMTVAADAEVEEATTDSGEADDSAMAQGSSQAVANPVEDVGIANTSTESTSEDPAQDEPTQIDTANLSNRRIIRNANLAVEVTDVRTALDGATALSTRFGGYVLGTQMWQVDTQEGDGFAARLRFAVPVGRFEAALEATRALGEVQQENASSQDVTAEFVDLEARLTNLEATATRIRGFLDEATDVEEALAVNEELSRIEGQIEQAKGRLNALTEQTAFSTIEVELLPLPPAVDPAQTLRTTAQWTPLRTIDDALGVLVQVAQVGLNALIWLAIVGGPIVLVGGLLIWLARRVWRSSRRVVTS